MVAIHEAKQSDIKRLLELSLMWEKEDSCYGYRANTEDDFQDCYILAAYDDELIAHRTTGRRIMRKRDRDDAT